MARPKSMSDFAQLLDVSAPVVMDKERPRKKPSISLAAGLIMNADSSKSTPSTPLETTRKDSSDNLFYAYAQKSDYAHSPPYILAFASASVAKQWWDLVKQEYPESTRVGPQLFILKGDDMQEQIQDNPKFEQVRNKWFYMPSNSAGGGIIPLQDSKGNPISTTPAGLPQSTRKDPIPLRKDPTISPSEKPPDEGGFDMSKLSTTLNKMSAMISENSAQIRALSVAQSEGLRRMQEINESNSTQIKALADSQSKLQTLIDQNASHYIALSNSSFSNQEQVRSVLQANAEHIKSLAEGQSQLALTCAGVMKTIDNLGSSVSGLANGRCDASNSLVGSSTATFSSVGNQISPPPRKLNRRVKGVWYEYDSASPAASARGSMVLQTPPKSPMSSRAT